MYKSPSSNKNTYNSASSLNDVMKTSPYENVLEPVTSSLGAQSEMAEDEKVYRVNLNILPVFFLETLALGSLAALAYVLRFMDVFPVLRRGFFCGAVSLSYPQEESSLDDVIVQIGPVLFYSVCLAVPIGMILLGELLYWLCSGQHRKVVRGGCVPCRLHLLLRRLLRFIGVFLLGLVVTSIVTDSLKLATGRLRPSFLSVCNMENSTGCQPGTYLTSKQYTCLQEDQQLLKLARLSFPSFHASVSGFAAAFTMVYTQWLMSGPTPSRLLLLPCLQGALATLALLCSSMRVALHKAHWEDALIGTALGVAIALYLAYSVLNGFHERRHHGCSPTLDSLEQCPGRLETGVGGVGAPTSAAQVPSSLFFRYFRIPHVSYRNSRPAVGGSVGGRTYADCEGGPATLGDHHHVTNSKPASLHEEFQRDLHQRIEDYVTKRPSMRDNGLPM